MYFLRGGLPWQGLKAATNKQKYEKIGEKKQSTPIKELCEGFPEEFGIYLNYVRKLGFEETPDYDFLRELFTKVLKSSGEPEDGVYDWMMLNGGKGWEAGTVSLLKERLGWSFRRRKQRRGKTDAFDVLSLFFQHRERASDRERGERERHRDPRSSQQVVNNQSSQQMMVPPQSAQLARNPSKGGRKSGVPGGLVPGSDGRQAGSTGNGGLRGSHGGDGGFQTNQSGYGGVGQGSNVAVHDATVAGLPTSGPNTPGGQSPHGNAFGQSGNGNQMLNHSTGGIEGGRRVDGRGPVGNNGMGNELVNGNDGMGNHHPAERQSFGTKLVNVLTCRCA